MSRRRICYSIAALTSLFIVGCSNDDSARKFVTRDYEVTETYPTYAVDSEIEKLSYAIRVPEADTTVTRPKEFEPATKKASDQFVESFVSARVDLATERLIVSLKKINETKFDVLFDLSLDHILNLKTQTLTSADGQFQADFVCIQYDCSQAWMKLTNHAGEELEVSIQQSVIFLKPEAAIKDTRSETDKMVREAAENAFPVTRVFNEVLNANEKVERIEQLVIAAPPTDEVAEDFSTPTAEDINTPPADDISAPPNDDSTPPTNDGNEGNGNEPSTPPTADDKTKDDSDDGKKPTTDLPPDKTPPATDKTPPATDTPIPVPHVRPIETVILTTRTEEPPQPKDKKVTQPPQAKAPNAPDFTAVLNPYEIFQINIPEQIVRPNTQVNDPLSIKTSFAITPAERQVGFEPTFRMNLFAQAFVEQRVRVYRHACNITARAIMTLSGYTQGQHFLANQFHKVFQHNTQGLRNWQTFTFNYNRTGLQNLDSLIDKMPEHYAVVMQVDRNRQGRHGHVGLLVKERNSIYIYDSSIDEHGPRRTAVTSQNLLTRSRPLVRIFAMPGLVQEAAK